MLGSLILCPCIIAGLTKSLGILIDDHSISFNTILKLLNSLLVGYRNWFETEHDFIFICVVSSIVELLLNNFESMILKEDLVLAN